MKSKVIFGFAVLLIFGCVVMGCDNGTTGGNNGSGGIELSGTWKGGMGNQTLSFQGNGYEVKKGDNSAYNNGTYSATENEITFNVVSGEHANGNCKVSYTKTETSLSLTYISGSGFDGLGIAGNYAKQ